MSSIQPYYYVSFSCIFAVQLLGYTDGALLDDAIDAIGARDTATLFKTIDLLVESGHDPRRFAFDLLERLRDLVIVDALADQAATVLRGYPQDQLTRMASQASTDKQIWRA